MPKRHTVTQGECMSSIAFAHGFFWETLWNHADNAELKRRREKPHVLLPGDAVGIPERELKQEQCAADQRHRFKRKGVPARLRLRLMCDDKPLANQPFELTVDMRTQKGNTDGDGRIDVPIPPDALTGSLVVGKGADQITYTLDFGSIDPLDTDSGVAGRLGDLGYDAESDLAEGIRAFQAKNGLSETGELDDATRDQLESAFGH